MKIKLSLAGLLAASLTFPQLSFAETEEAGTGPNPFSDCGIGAAIFSDTAWAAATSNIIWDVGTTAITSATASPETCNGKDLQAAVFINNTYESLAEETAKGQGEHLTALLNIYQCSSQTSAIAEIRSNMSSNISSGSYDKATHLEKASMYYDIVSSAISSKCSA